MTPREVLALCREKDVKAVDLRFMDFPGHCGSISPFPSASSTRTCSKTAWASTAPAFAAGRRSTRATCSWCRSPRRPFSIRSPQLPTLVMICNIQDPITREGLHAAIRGTSPARRSTTCKSTGIADTCFIGPEAEFFVFDDVRFDQNAHEGYYHVDSGEGQWNRGRDESPNLGYKLRYKEGYFPVPAGRPADGPPQRDDADHDRLRPGRRSPASRSRHRRPVRDRPAVPAAGADGRQDDDLQVHRQERRPAAQQDGDVHAQAAVRRQRLAACTPTSRSGRTTSRCSPAAATPA